MVCKSKLEVRHACHVVLGGIRRVCACLIRKVLANKDKFPPSPYWEMGALSRPVAPPWALSCCSVLTMPHPRSC